MHQRDQRVIQIFKKLVNTRDERTRPHHTEKKNNNGATETKRAATPTNISDKTHGALRHEIEQGQQKTENEPKTCISSTQPSNERKREARAKCEMKWNEIEWNFSADACILRRYFFPQFETPSNTFTTHILNENSFFFAANCKFISFLLCSFGRCTSHFLNLKTANVWMWNATLGECYSNRSTVMPFVASTCAFILPMCSIAKIPIARIMRLFVFVSKRLLSRIQNTNTRMFCICVKHVWTICSKSMQMLFLTFLFSFSTQNIRFILPVATIPSISIVFYPFAHWQYIVNDHHHLIERTK